MGGDERSEFLVTRAAAGELMTWLTAPGRADAERRRDFDCLAELHGDGRLDVFAHLGRPSAVDEWRLDVAAWARVYRELVPALDGTAEVVIARIECLAAGMWSPVLQDAFMDWCARDMRRIEEVLVLEDRPEIPDWFFAAALISGLRVSPLDYLRPAIDYAEGRRRARMAGIRGIAVMSVQDRKLTREAVAALGRVMDDPNAPDQDRSGALTAALEVAQRCETVDDLLSAMVARATLSGRVDLLRVCCDALARFRGRLRKGLMPPLLDALRSLDLADPEACATADGALYGLLESGHVDEALSCIEYMACRSPAPSPLLPLGSTTHFLASRTADLLPRVICRWLETGDGTLCAAARHFLVSTGDQKLAFDFDPGNRDWAPDHTLFVARKAVGWLMPHATAPASFLVCLLRHASREAAAGFADLLLDPLLINYPLATRAYLEEACPKLPAEAKAVVEDILARHDRYRRSIAEVRLLPELQPPERHRWIEARRQHEGQARICREAEGASVIRHLATKQILLYGVTAILHVDDPGGGTRRFENRLAVHSFTTDNAMGWVYDPCDLEFTLRIFRAQRKGG